MSVLFGKEAVKVTLGPKGRNVVMQRPFGAPTITKDGVSVAKRIELSDSYEDMGAQMLKDVASKSSDDAGDGTTTATVLAQSIINEGIKSVETGFNPMDIKRGIDIAIKEAVEYVLRNSSKITSGEQIEQVGTISANGDTEVGELLALAMQKVGTEGVITVEATNTSTTELNVVEGFQFNSGYLSPYFVTGENSTIIEYDNPVILFFDGAITGSAQIASVLEKAVNENRPLVIIANNVSGEALQTLLINNGNFHGDKQVRVVAIKAPAFADRKKQILEDMAILTGGVSIADGLSIDMNQITIEHLGGANKVIISEEETTIIGGYGEKENVNKRIDQVNESISDDNNDWDNEKLKERIAKLSGGIAVIKVGGGSELEVEEKKARIEDALHSTRAAIESGIVAGGGATLTHASRSIATLKGVNADQDIGIAIAKKAMLAPLKQIAKNAGVEDIVISNKVYKNNNINYGYNAQTEKYGDMLAMGVIDPAKVTTTALTAAGSIAGLMITTECINTPHFSELHSRTTDKGVKYMLL